MIQDLKTTLMPGVDMNFFATAPGTTVVTFQSYRPFTKGMRKILSALSGTPNQILINK